MSLICRFTGPRVGPGPADYEIKSKLGDSPRFTLKGRNDIPDRPNAAGYVSLPTCVGEGHKFSLSGRPHPLAAFNTPGPAYVPPSFGSQAKKSTLHLRTDELPDDRLRNPGPGAYENKHRAIGSDSPRFSLRSRQKDDVVSRSPGPAAYHPAYEKVQRSPHVPTLHIRPNELSKDKTPGPGEYEIGRDMGGMRATMHVRPRGLSVDNNPGPGAYTPRDNTRSNPRFTIKGRHEVPDRDLHVGYLDIGTTIGTGHKASLSSRHKELERFNTPGPTYVPPSFGSQAKKSTLHLRTDELPDDRLRNPGPGAYESSPRFGSQGLKYTMRGRTAKDPDDISPGPAAYSPDFKVTKKKSPSPTLHIRPKEPERDQTPGYRKLPSTFNGPRYSIGQRDTLDFMLM